MIPNDFNALFLTSSSSIASISAELGSIQTWIKYRLGEPLLNVELDNGQIDAAVEESIIQFSSSISKFKSKNSYLSMIGIRKDSFKPGYSPMPSLSFIKRYILQFGTDGNGGGDLTYNKGYIIMQPNQTQYDLSTALMDYNTNSPVSLTGMLIPKQVYHNAQNANLMYFDPYYGSNFLLYSEFGNTDAWAINSKMLYAMPLYEHLMRFQFFNNFNKLFKSQYKWNIIGTMLTLSPKPVTSFKLYIDWIDSVKLDAVYGNRLSDIPDSSLSAFTSDITDIPLNNLDYSLLNDFSKNWIRQYSLAICKEMLGLIRSKVQNNPIPDTEIILNGAELVDEGKTSQVELKRELDEFLDSIVSSEAVTREEKILEVSKKYLEGTPIGKIRIL